MCPTIFNLIFTMIIKFAYFLRQFQHYQNIKAFFYTLLENKSGRYGRCAAFFITGTVLLSVLAFIYEIDEQNNELSQFIERAVLLIFATEYLLRLWLVSDSHKIILAEYERSQYLSTKFPLWSALRAVALEKIHYMSTTMAIIDLLAILPSFDTFHFFR